jgi:hypothetical protein
MAMNVFLSYVYKDEPLRDVLVAHLDNLRWKGIITEWHERNVNLGKEWLREIDPHLDTAQIILLLVSPEFVNSDYCYSLEIKHALQRHEAGQAHVIPIVLRPVDLEDTPFARLLALPTYGKPVTSWFNLQETFLDVARGIEEVIMVSNPNPLLAHRRLPVPCRWAWIWYLLGIYLIDATRSLPVARMFLHICTTCP